MEEMVHTGKFKPSAEHEAKINEFVTWLSENNYTGYFTLHGEKNVAVSWLNGDKDSLRNDIEQSIASMLSYDREAGTDLVAAILSIATDLMIDIKANQKQ